MMNDIITIDTNNYAAMAKAMGIANETSSSSDKKASTLARFRISHTPIMGMADVNGKQKNVEIVEGGSFKLEVPEGPTYYASSARLRPYLQRYMYKKFVMGKGDTKNRYVKTIMADNLNTDLKDNDGGFNCGKPAGWVKDFKALDQSKQDLIRSIKRVRVVLGTVELINPVDEKGASVDVDTIPCIWEVENREAYNTIGGCFSQFAKMKRLPVQHHIDLVTEARKLPNGNQYYVPATKLDLTQSLRVEDKEQSMFADFMLWVDNYNDYILNSWNENVHSKQEVDIEGEDFVDVEDATVQ